MEFKKANFNLQQIEEIVYELYGIIGSTYRLGGIANDNYRVKNEKYDIAIKVYSQGQTDDEKIAKEIEAVSFFIKNGVNVPQYVYGKNGKIIQEYDGYSITASSFIEGEMLDNAEFTEESMNGVGKLVATIEVIAPKIDINGFGNSSLVNEYNNISKGLGNIIKIKNYDYNLTEFKEYLPQVLEIMKTLDSCQNKQFLHRDIWPPNIISNKDKQLYLLDFNDWLVGNPVLELSVTLLEFAMFKSGEFNNSIASSIIFGYEQIKKCNYSNDELWSGMLVMCYIYFAYNVVQAETQEESEIYLERIHSLLCNRDIPLN